MSVPPPSYSAAEVAQPAYSQGEKYDGNDKVVIVHEEDVTDAAARGHAATDAHGKSLVHFDPAAEKRLVRKIDLMVVPTVAML